MLSPENPWNKGRHVGQKKPFTVDQIQQITRVLEFAKRFDELCLFCLGIDTMLRGSDLLSLKVADVMDANRHPKTELRYRQKKNDHGVYAAILPYTRSTVSCHVANSDLGPNDYLFSARNQHHIRHLSTSYLRRLVKRWAKEIGLDPTDYSGHSLRRSKAVYLFEQGVHPARLRLLLGHKSLESTQAYLGIDQHDALRLARQFDCFRSS